MNISMILLRGLVAAWSVACPVANQISLSPTLRASRQVSEVLTRPSGDAQ